LKYLTTLSPNDCNKNLTCLHKDSASLTKTKAVEIVTVNSETDWQPFDYRNSKRWKRPSRL